MKKKLKLQQVLAVLMLLLCLGRTGMPAYAENAEKAESVVRFDLTLDSYVPKKDHYNFFFTYKTVHAWWDAVAMGMEDAQKQFLNRGIVVTYEYLAPEVTSAEDQKNRLLAAARKDDYDVIGVDVADESVISPVLDQLADAGIRVMTFSSSDAAPGCRRIAYVGNTHNYTDGANLARALCEKLGGKGKIAVLVGTRGAPCHEDRARGVRDIVAEYPDMEIVSTEYDQDSINLAYDLTMKILDDHPDLSGLVCCNMSNPVGAARAVKETGRDIVIVGMDHDREAPRDLPRRPPLRALRDLRDGVIYCLGIQDCYSIGFDTLQVAVKIADDVLPGTLYPEKTEKTTTIIFRQDADKMLELLYGEF